MIDMNILNLLYLFFFLIENQKDKQFFGSNFFFPFSFQEFPHFLDLIKPQSTTLNYRTINFTLILKGNSTYVRIVLLIFEAKKETKFTLSMGKLEFING